LRNLRELDLYNTQVSETGVQGFAELHPKCQIWR
jgi:hypothetical protein